ncbi:MAG: DUF3098 domain-containing protein [Candidatus Cryptobacteroides sp.]
MDKKLAIGKKGLVLMLIGLALMLLGYVLMAGGGVKDPQVFNYSMFNFQRLVLSPLLIVAGIVLIALSIIKKEKD